MSNANTDTYTMAKRQTGQTVAKDNNKDEDSSDFEDIPVGLTPAEMEKLGKFGKVLIQSAVSELRGEFQKFAKEAVEIALCGDDIAELQDHIDKQETELEKLRKDLKRLEDESRKQRGGNIELRKEMRQKEKEIAMKENQISQLRRRLLKCQKSLNDEHEQREKVENQLRDELDELKAKYNKVKGRLLAKDAADHIAREKLPELRQRITELEEQLAKEKAKRK